MRGGALLAGSGLFLKWGYVKIYDYLGWKTEHVWRFVNCLRMIRLWHQREVVVRLWVENWKYCQIGLLFFHYKLGKCRNIDKCLRSPHINNMGFPRCFSSTNVHLSCWNAFVDVREGNSASARHRSNAWRFFDCLCLDLLWR